MIKEIIMPQGSQDLVPAKVVRWVVGEGSPVKKGDVICEVETEKAVFEIDAPVDGYLRKIITPAGEMAEVFAIIGYVGYLGDPIPGESTPAQQLLLQWSKPPQPKQLLPKASPGSDGYASHL